MGRHDRSARGEALRKLIKVDGRVRPKRTLELLAERFPAQAAVHLELLAEEIEDKGDVTAQELGILLGKTEVALLRSLVLERLVNEGLIENGEEHPLFKTFKSLDASLCQWVRIHLSVPVQSATDSPVNVSELWSSALKPPVGHPEPVKKDTMEVTDKRQKAESEASMDSEADSDNDEDNEIQEEG